MIAVKFSGYASPRRIYRGDAGDKKFWARLTNYVPIPSAISKELMRVTGYVDLNKHMKINNFIFIGGFGRNFHTALISEMLFSKELFFVGSWCRIKQPHTNSIILTIDDSIQSTEFRDVFIQMVKTEITSQEATGARIISLAF